ncbi:hypothetical protein EUA06_13790 [Nocardioides glacieisoli]|uniref:Uncharacterized protein n=1 Tax=Nocardioides glacieisoli TaxID=1168730 RepID=A0A4Q2RPD8_9ACTN|nr:hypothetical protein [Nocardioides glacieisoli]RYB89674.1 hypothetical protein EUA06_13790 [Nocardioides glacieisoli]
MARTGRPTQQSAIGKAFGGRSGFVSEELDRRDRSDPQGRSMSRWERSAARQSWDDASNHYEEYADENRFRVGRLLPSYELLVAIAIVLVFVGGYAAFIAFLALTR